MGDVLDTVFGGGSKATGRAINAQRRAAGDANLEIERGFGTAREDLSDLVNVGGIALDELAGNKFAQNLEMDPGYNFRLQEGRRAVDSSAAARGMLNSGRTLKELTRFGQQLGSQEYGNAYNREFGRLSTLAGMGANAMGQTANLAMGEGQALSNNITGIGNAAAAANIAQANRQSDLIGQGMSAAALFAMSDRNLKKNLKPIDKSELQEMKKHLKAYAFNYINDEHGKGEWIGIMAQDLEKSRLGKTLVVVNNDGHKMIDLKKVLSMFLATLAEA